MSKHTKGPWSMTTSSKGNHFMSVPGHCEFVKIYSGVNAGITEEQKSNALLISKAPEMLEMLESVVAMFATGKILHVDKVVEKRGEIE